MNISFLQKISFRNVLGWCRGYCFRDPKRVGIFPSAYLQIKPCRMDVDG